MRVVAVAALPFHVWVLSGVIYALRRSGVTVDLLVHAPKGDRDWLVRQTDSGRIPSFLASTHPDAVLCCEYPYPMLSRWAGGAPVVTLRHSLAGRRNTWESEQAEADLIPTWSSWDERALVARAGANLSRFARTGCVFLEPLAHETHRPNGVLWAPSHNRELSCRNWVVPVLAKIRALGYPVDARLHAASGMREPGLVTELGRAGIPAHIGDSAPYSDLLSARVLVADVSGISLLGAHLPGLPVVQVDARAEDVQQSRQFDPLGPEWQYREAIGPLARDAKNLEALILERLREDYVDPWAPARQAVTTLLTGGLESSWGATERVAAEMVSRFSR